MTRRASRRDPARQAYWQELVRRWQESGQSIREFCAVERIREPSFYVWKRRFARREESAEGGQPQSKTLRARRVARPAKQASQAAAQVPSFLPVHLLGVPGEAPRHGGIEIVLVSGLRLRVRSGFDRQTLADVLAVLEVRPC